MKRWTVVDRQGREIYLTQERWAHILSKHAELNGRLEDVLTTIALDGANHLSVTHRLSYIRAELRICQRLMIRF